MTTQPDSQTITDRGYLGILLERSNLPIEILRQDGQRVFANRACVALFGHRSHDEFLSSPPLASVAPEHLGHVRRTVREFFESDLDTCVIENRSLRADGMTIWLEAHLQRVEWRDEPALLVIFVDVTHRRNTEDALRRSETSFRALIETSNLPTQILRLDGTRLFVNEAAVRLFGYDSIAELLAVPPFGLVAPERRRDSRRRFNEFLKGGEQGRIYIYDAIRKDSTLLHLQTHQQIVRWEGADAIFMVFLDITEQERGEQIVRESEERLKNAERIANFGNWEIEVGTHKLTVSDQAMRILGLGGDGTHPDTADIVGMFHPDDRPRVLRTRAEAIRTGAAYSLDYRLVRRDGEVRHIRERGEVARAGEDGRPRRLSGVVQDMTDLYEARTALAEREQFYTELVELLPDPVYIHADQRIVMANSATARQFRASGIDDIIGRDPDDLLHPDDLPILHQHRRDRAEGVRGAPYSRLRYRRLDGSVYDGEGNSAVITWGGRAARVVVVRDATERLAAERRVKANEERLKEAQRIARVGDWEYDKEMKEAWWSEEMCRIFGVSPEAGLRTRNEFLDMVHPDDRECLRHDAARENEPYSGMIEYRIVRADGEIRDVRSVREFLPGTDGGPARLRGITQDITDERKAAEALRASEEAFRDLIEGAVLGTQIRTFSGRRLYVNRAFREMFGFALAEEALVAPEGNIAAPHERSRVLGYMDARQRGEPAPMEYDLDCIRQDGTIFPTRVYMRKIVWQGQQSLQMTVVDLSDLKRAEHEVQKLNQELETRVEQRTEELRQAQSELVKRERLATLGQLTATVSHELRNPLGAMRSSMYVVRKRIGEVDSQMAATLERIDRNISRCDAIIDELLDFTRIRALQCDEVPLDEWLGELLDEQALPGHIMLDRAFCAPRTRARIDPDRMRRAVINALDNAVQAADDNPACAVPRVTVATRARGDRLEIAISDNGPGMEANVLSQVFEPLYSTRSFGVGLGLPVIKQIMEQHRGGVEIETEPGKGTTVTLWTPGDA